MGDVGPQVAAGKVLWHFTMSLDGFVAGPGHAMDWIVGESRPGLVEEYVATTGAVLGGRTGDEIDLHIAPVLLGDGIRLYDNPGRAPVRLAPSAVVNVRYRPA